MISDIAILGVAMKSGSNLDLPYIFVQNFKSMKYIQVIKLCLFILVVRISC
jgi:hypothetical protein